MQVIVPEPASFLPQVLHPTSKVVGALTKHGPDDNAVVQVRALHRAFSRAG